MSTNIFNRDDGNKLLSYAQIDNDFDSYWENEARNPVRNRIRIGKQYQATIQPLLKPNEFDKRKLEDREILRWTPENELNEQQLEQYLQLVKAILMFSKVVKNEDLLSLSNSTNIAISETGNKNQIDKERTTEKLDKNELNGQQLNKEALNKRFKLIFKSLSQFLNAHHPNQADKECKLFKKISNKNDLINKSNDGKLNNSELTETECILFTAALQACGKNFSSIKEEFLPCKFSKAIMDYYNLCLNQKDNLNYNQSQISDEDNEKKKCNELRNKLDARLADGKDIKLKHCSSDLNSVLFNLIKDNYGLKESDTKNQTLVNNDKEDNLTINSSMNSLSNGLPSSSMNSSSNKNSNLRSSNRNTTKNNSEDKTTTKDQNNDKKTNKNNLKLNDKRISLRSTNKTQKLDNKILNPTNVMNKTEIKDQYEFDEKVDAADYNSLGSLKFYKDGQLILKLNAKQAEKNSKCQCKWEESVDSIEMNKLRRNYKKKRIDVIHKLKEPLEHNKATKISNENQDDSLFESSEDSRSSSNCSNLQKPLTTMNNLFKKAKVKVENNYYVPLPSASLNANSTNIKEDDELNNGKSISPSNEDDLKRKTKTPKNNSKKKVLKLNQGTNKLNFPPNLIQQQLNHLSSENLSNQNNLLLDQHNFLSSLPLDLKEKLISLSSDSIFKNLNEFKGLNDLNEINNLNGLNLNLNGLNNLNNLNNLNLNNFNNLDNLNAFNLNNLNNQQRNQNNLDKLLASFAPQFSPNTFLENIDSIKMQNQIQSLMTNLNALIEADQFK